MFTRRRLGSATRKSKKSCSGRLCLEEFEPRIVLNSVAIQSVNVRVNDGSPRAFTSEARLEPIPFNWRS